MYRIQSPEVLTKCGQWLLHLLADDEPKVVTLATKILARLLVVSGSAYVQKFVDKTGGIVIMQRRLKRWWYLPTMWPVCFAVLFGVDVANIDFSRTFDLFSLLDIFVSAGEAAVQYPAMLPVITAMLGEGLKTVTRDQLDPDSPIPKKSNGKGTLSLGGQATPTHVRQRSVALTMGTFISSEFVTSSVYTAIASNGSRPTPTLDRPA